MSARAGRARWLRRAGASLLAIGAAITAAPALAQAATGIEAGLYRIESRLTADVSGRAVEMPPVQFSRCITADSVGSLDPGAAQGGCAIVEQSIEGRRAAWTVRCEGQARGTIHYEAVFGPGSYSAFGTADMTYPDGSRARLRIEQSGTRIGPCP